jgi:hypothetical protein
MAQLVTPERIEQRLLSLSSLLDSAQDHLEKVEQEYAQKKSLYEIGMAEARIKLGSSETKLRVQEIEDNALIQCKDRYWELNMSEALVKAARSDIIRLRTQVDIARSIGTSVRAAMEL